MVGEAFDRTMFGAMLVVVAALVWLFFCTGFAHYEELPPQCPDATWAPRPPPNPQVTRFELNHAVITDGPIRCVALCLECTNPAIDCVVLPEAR